VSRDLNRRNDHGKRSSLPALRIDVATPIFDVNGELLRDVFVQDGLHPSAKCYAMWAAIIKPILLERFAGTNSSASPKANAAVQLGLPVLQGGFLGI
jgi:hypothetical protein